MNNEQKFWVSLWAAVLFFFLVLTGLLTSYYDSKNEIIANLIYNDIDPLAISCGLDGQDARDPLCIILATQQAY